MRLTGTPPTPPTSAAQRAYAASSSPASAPARVPASDSLDVSAVLAAARDQRQTNLSRLVAGVVPGRVDFSGDTPQPSGSEALPMYRRPADRNAAATGVQAGRLIDVRG